MSSYRVSADIGGTFTDFVVEENGSQVFTGKVSTTPENPAFGVLNGIKELVSNPDEIEFLVHGTTVGLNAFLERKGERVLLVMTAGVSDSYSIARGDRKELYSLHYRKPERLVPRRDVHEVRERVKWDGTVLEPLNRSDFDPIIEKIKAEEINAVAICLIHAYAFPEHERQAREILAAACPGLSITLSHEVAREWREYERASSAVMNAYTAPIVEKYLSSLETQVRDMGVSSTLHVMQSSGGVMTLDAARKLPVYTLLSGPVGGTIGGISLSKAIDRPNLLCVDMGGTSFDLSLVINGQPEITSETELEGLPLLLSIVNIHTIGAGGGSLAWLEAGALRMGPQSAGSIPGPVCYGRGGTQPTVTDANLYLKRLGAGSLLSGRMTLDEEATATAIQRLAQEVGLSEIELAEGMLAITNAKMADAMRTITVEQGIDPRQFSLVAFGGAGPMQAVWLARELDIREIIIPRFPGTFSAWGMLQTDLRQDLTQNYYHPTSSVTIDAVQAVIQQLTQEGASALAAEGTAAKDMYFVATTDMRYSGQEYTVTVQIEHDATLAEIEAAFHSAHHTRYGHSTPDAPVEFVNLRLAAMGQLEKEAGQSAIAVAAADPVIGSREAIFDGQPQHTPILNRELMPAGSAFLGPLVIEEQSATTVVPPGYSVRVDTLGNIIITQAEEKHETPS
ncbi:MAG: hydantoinase/oxoprolinase family protein [Chloroflexota bacterium]